MSCSLKVRGYKKIERKKYDTEQQEPNMNDWLPMREKDENRLQEEKLMTKVPKNKKTK